ncbi:hypothetical protein BDW68DRAFT_183298 [Aspergillus falconensis]
MTRERRKWTPEEDILLRRAVQAGLGSNYTAITESRPILWREIAKSVPTRSNKDCRRRWCNSLSTSLSKGPWTESEDERLWNAVQKHGPKWSLVSKDVGSRNADQCSSHWGQTLNPEIDFRDWSERDDETLTRSVELLGTNWSTIASLYFPRRTPLALRNRFNALGARQQEGSREKRSAGNRVEKKTRCMSRASPIFSRLRNGYKEDSEDDNYNGHEDDYEGEEEDEEDEEGKEELSRYSGVERHRKATTRRSEPDESWMNPDSGTATSSLPLVETPPGLTLSQSAPYSTIPYTMPELDIYNDPSCWDSMLRVTGPETAPGLSQELEKSTVNATCSYPPRIPQDIPPGADQSVVTMHRISIDVECTSQQLPQIMSNVIAIGGRVTMKLNHSSPDSGGLCDLGD